MTIPDETTTTLIDKLEKEIEYHRYRYYELDDPIISDPEFDQLHEQLLEYQKQYPSIQDHVGIAVMRSPVVHKHQMLSLRSVKETFNIFAAFTRHQGCLSCEPKIDGLSLELVYESGRLQVASTRGDGQTGEDVTRNVLKIHIPQLIDGDHLEVYGEVYITKRAFQLINEQRIKKGNAPYANARNAAAGISRSDEAVYLLQYLSFFPYTVYGRDFATQADCYQWLETQGFDTLADYIQVTDSDKALSEFITKSYERRERLDFEIDGLVFKINELTEREKWGTANTHPNWAIAYKFEPDRALTRLNDVVFQIGKSGIIAPVAILDEVMLRTSKVTRASLSNESIIKAKDIRINDMVYVEMANDVIPYIAEVVLEERIGKEIPIEFPKQCPSCQQSITKIGPHYVCTNPQCPAQIFSKLVAAVSRKGFDIKGLGRTTIKLLIQYGLIHDISDVFLLSNHDYQQRMITDLNFGVKTVENLCKEIQKARRIPLHRFISALSIPDVSTGIAMKLAEHYQTISQMIQQIPKGIVNLQNTSRQTLEQIEEFFKQPISVTLITKLLANGVQPIDIIPQTIKHKIVVSGVLSVPRSELIEYAQAHGYHVDKQVSRHTCYLVRGEGASAAKVERAYDLNVPIITEQEFRRICLSLNS